MNIYSILTAVGKITCAAAVIAATPYAAADERERIPSLSGTWVMAISGIDGCGFGTKRVNVTLRADLTLTVPATVINHAQGCGDSQPTNWSFQFVSYDHRTGSGHAVLSCGPGCGWEYEVQTNLTGNTFSMVDVSPLNPGNFQSGIAVKQAH
jgi:hypothetical protein